MTKTKMNLHLDRETIRNLNDSHLTSVMGAGVVSRIAISGSGNSGLETAITDPTVVFTAVCGVPLAPISAR